MLRKVLVPLVVVLLFSGLTLFAQQQAPVSKDENSSSGGMMGMHQHQMMAQTQNMPADCQKAMEMRHQMMSKHAEMDKKLEGLIAKMNAAKGNEKVDAMAAVINELVAQRKSMQQMMMTNQPMMMKSMMDCPMMQNMMTDQGKEAPKEQHPKQ